MNLVERLQAYLRQLAYQQYEAVAVPPFTLFFHPRSDFAFFNYAIPDNPVEGALREPLAQLRAEFRARGRRPRFEYLEEFAPDLAPALHDADFEQQGRYPLMVCTPDSWREAPPVTGLTWVRLTTNSPDADIRAYLSTQRLGFSPTSTNPVSDADIENFRQELGAAGAFLGRLGGEPVGGAAFGAPLDGMTEVAGVATLEAFRRQGIASVLVAEAVQVAFREGVEVALLSAADEQAGRVYERVGFRKVANALAYWERESQA